MDDQLPYPVHGPDSVSVLRGSVGDALILKLGEFPLSESDGWLALRFHGREVLLHHMRTTTPVSKCKTLLLFKIEL